MGGKKETRRWLEEVWKGKEGRARQARETNQIVNIISKVQRMA